MKKYKHFLILVFSAFFINLALGNCALADDSQPTNGWQFQIAPYGWLSSINANITVRNTTANVNVPFSKILNNLDFAAQAHIEASNGPWAFMIDPTYIKLSTNLIRNIINANITSETTLIDAGIFYRICSDTMTNGQYLSLELLGGGRYLGLNNKLAFASGIILSGSTQVAAPIVGARFKYDVTPKIHLWLRGDVGGFDVDSVDNTWDATAGFAYSVSQHIDLGLAYKVLEIDVTKTQNSAFNALLYGPMVGIVFYF